MNFLPRLILLIAALGGLCRAEDLPFSGERISRRSLDDLPRSLSIRQGTGVWLGYDLERAKVCKVWQARAGKAGLVAAQFVTKSAGTAWFEDKSEASWELQREGKVAPLTVRYLGCSQRADHFELSWELRHAAGVLTLRERVPMASAAAPERVLREVRVERLKTGEALVPPAPAREVWKLSGKQGVVAALSEGEWHRLTLP